MRIVVKIGTSTLAHPTGHLNIRRVEELCKIMSDIKNAGHEMILVSSGAIGMGVGKLGLRERPRDIPGKQAAAAVGQCELMYTYDKLFSEYHHTVAQLLITGDDTKNEQRHENFTNTINRLLELGALPIINENDTVATNEIVIGDNDTLAAIVAESVGADLLILLSDIDGLYTADPHKDPTAVLLHKITAIDDAVRALAGVSAGSQGTGGMVEDGITLAYGYEENCFRESEENDAYVLYSVGARKVKLAADFLYADHSSVANPGDPEPEWARGDAAAFPDYIAGRELYGNNSYAQIRSGELAALNIEWVP